MNALRHLLMGVSLLWLAACGGGAPTTVNPQTAPPTVSNYNGPAPSTADVQAFRINLWENIKGNDRCGSCHNAQGQAPRFARNDDVNLAYADANPIVDLARPDQSRLVLKVASGHNCWLTSTSACADILTAYIRNWAGAAAGAASQVQLQVPPDRTVGSSRSFPASASDNGGTSFENTIWPLVRGVGNCVRCHSPTAATPQSPFFASADAQEAYGAARAKIDLDSPARSRLVVRLREESHNCWSGNCVNDANTMQAQVEAFVNGIAIAQVNPQWVVSKALALYDGTVASGGNRFDGNVIAKYEFKTGTGPTAFDTSGVEPAINLTLSGSAEWVGGWGLRFGPGGKAQGTTTSSKKLSDRIKATGEYSVELWATPANVVQEDAYLFSYSGGVMSRNVTVAQRAYQYEVMARSSTTGANGAPALLTRDADRDAQASLQHLVLTYDPVNGRRLFVNGSFTGDADPRSGGSIADWDDTFALVLGNETSNNRQWQGVLRMVAVHSRVLTAEQIQQNFAAGVGERYFLLFNVSELSGVPQSYVMFEGSQFDSYSYLFNKPTFISLDGTARPASIPLKGMRIGLNGSEPSAGQGYTRLDTVVGGSNYSPTAGQLLSEVGTIIGLQKGPAADQFFLTFEQIGTRTNVRVEGGIVSQPPIDLAPRSDFGVRTFDQLNQSFSRITGIATTRAGVRQTFLQVKQQLPPIPEIDAFLASHQTGIAQLAIKYCAEMVDDAPARAAFFGAGLNLSQSGAAAFGSQAGKDLVIQPLFEKAVGVGLINQPLQSNVSVEVSALMDKLIAGNASAPSIVKAACAAVLGSGAIAVQ